MPSWHRQRNGTLNLFAALNVATGHATHKKNDDWLAAHPKETADSAPDKANPGEGVLGRVRPPARLLRRARLPCRRVL
jgi:hypothetical protein